MTTLLVISMFMAMIFMLATVFRFSGQLGLGSPFHADEPDGDDVKFVDRLWQRTQYVSGLATLLAFGLSQTGVF